MRPRPSVRCGDYRSRDDSRSVISGDLDVVCAVLSAESHEETRRYRLTQAITIVWVVSQLLKVGAQAVRQHRRHLRPPQDTTIM